MKDKSERKSLSWHSQQEKVLQNWGEQSGGYRLIHDACYRQFKSQTMRFTIPVIIMSTVTGTANFAQDSFPLAWQHLVPACIGFVNLVAAVLTTIAQYLKVQELQESNRVSSVAFAKLHRDITVELNLPIDERSCDGSDYLRQCQTEFDRLIEQSPPIPKNIINNFKKSKTVEEGVSLPDIFTVKKLQVYKDKERKASIIVADAAKHLRRNNVMRQKEKLESKLKTFAIPTPLINIPPPSLQERDVENPEVTVPIPQPVDDLPIEEPSEPVAVRTMAFKLENRGKKSLASLFDANNENHKEEEETDQVKSEVT